MSEKVYCKDCDVWISDESNVKKHKDTLKHINNSKTDPDEIKKEIDKLEMKCPICFTVILSIPALKKHLDKKHKISNDYVKNIIESISQYKEEKTEIKKKENEIEKLRDEIIELKQKISKQEGILEEKEKNMKLMSKSKSVINKNNSNVTVNQSFFDKYFPDADVFMPNNTPEKLIIALNNVRKNKTSTYGVYESILRQMKTKDMLDLVSDIILEIYKNKSRPDLQSIWSHMSVYALRCKEKKKKAQWCVTDHGILIVDKIIIPIIESLCDIINLCKPKMDNSNSKKEKQNKVDELRDCSNCLKHLQILQKKPQSILKDIQYWFKIDLKDIVSKNDEKIKEKQLSSSTIYYIKTTKFVLPVNLSHEQQSWYFKFDYFMLKFVKIEPKSRLYISHIKDFYKNKILSIDALSFSIPSLHNFKKIFIMFAKDNKYKFKKNSKGYYLRNYAFRTNDEIFNF